MQIDAKSGSNSIGFFTLTGAELMDWPRKNNGIIVFFVIKIIIYKSFYFITIRFIRNSKKYI